MNALAWEKAVQLANWVWRIWRSANHHVKRRLESQIKCRVAKPSKTISICAETCDPHSVPRTRALPRITKYNGNCKHLEVDQLVADLFYSIAVCQTKTLEPTNSAAAANSNTYTNTVWNIQQPAVSTEYSVQYSFYNYINDEMNMNILLFISNQSLIESIEPLQSSRFNHSVTRQSVTDWQVKCKSNVTVTVNNV